MLESLSAKDNESRDPATPRPRDPATIATPATVFAPPIPVASQGRGSGIDSRMASSVQFLKHTRGAFARYGTFY